MCRFDRKTETQRDQSSGPACDGMRHSECREEHFYQYSGKRKAAQTGDRPGVTKSLQWIKLDKAIELLDTPGVLWPKFEGEYVGERLALLGSIRDEVVTQDDLAFYGCKWLMENDPQALATTYGIELQDTPYDTLLEIGRKRVPAEGCGR